jgi:hypothetical protein
MNIRNTLITFLTHWENGNMALQLIEESRRPLDSELPQDWAGSGLEDDVLVPFSTTIGS